MFIVFDATAEATAPWPVVGARVLTSGVLLTYIATRARAGLETLRPALGTIVLTGIFDTGSNVLFLLATNMGDLSVVAVLSSLYPAITVLLAKLVLDEDMSKTQLAGLASAIVASVLIALG